MAPFEDLAAGASLEALLDWFDGVEEWQVKSALQNVPENGDRMSPVLGSGWPGLRRISWDWAS